MYFVADAHAVLWFLQTDTRLSARAREILASPESEIIIPAVALAEVIHTFRKLGMSGNASEVVEKVLNAVNATIYPLDAEVLRRLPPVLDIHDGAIAVTALVLSDKLGQDIPLITADKEITKSGLVRTIW